MSAPHAICEESRIKVTQAALKHMIDQCTGMCAEGSRTLLQQFYRTNSENESTNQMCGMLSDLVQVARPSALQALGQAAPGGERLLVSIAYRRDPAKPSSRSKATQLCNAIDYKI